MGIVTGILVYVILWWLSFFAILPIGIRSQAEDADFEAAPGIDPGAPMNPNLLRKALITSIVAALLWVITYVAITQNFYSFR